MKTFVSVHVVTITFYEEKDTEKNKTLQATDFSLNLSTDILLIISKTKGKKQP